MRKQKGKLYLGMGQHEKRGSFRLKKEAARGVTVLQRGTSSRGSKKEGTEATEQTTVKCTKKQRGTGPIAPGVQKGGDVYFSRNRLWRGGGCSKKKSEGKGEWELQRKCVTAKSLG